MRHVVIVQQIAFERRAILGRTPVLQPDAIVHARVVDQRVDSAERGERLLDSALAVLDGRKIAGHHVYLRADRA